METVTAYQVDVRIWCYKVYDRNADERPTSYFAASVPLLVPGLTRQFSESAMVLNLGHGHHRISGTQADPTSAAAASVT
jgi:hypothetical protein